jgi:hypothetical protein
MITRKVRELQADLFSPYKSRTYVPILKEYRGGTYPPSAVKAVVVIDPTGDCAHFLENRKAKLNCVILLFKKTLTQTPPCVIV